MSDNWLNTLKEKVENAGGEVSPGGFDAIWNTVQKRKRSRRILAVSLAAAAAVAAVLIPALSLRSVDGEMAVPHRNQAMTADVPETAADPAPAVTVPLKAKRVAALPEVPSDSSCCKAGDAVVLAARNEEASAQPEDTHNESRDETRKETREKTLTESGMAYLAQVTKEDEKPSRRHRMHISVSGATPGNGQMSANTNPCMQYVSVIRKDDSPESQLEYVIESKAGPEGDRRETIMSYAVFDQYKHSMPLNFRLLAAYDLNDALSVESGLSYSYHHSTFSSEAGVEPLNRHFIGIPLGMKYDFLSYGPASFYARAGGLAEKCVSGDIEPLFWSVEVSLGTQVNVVGSLKLFLEGGGSYHFDNGTGIITIYGTKPLMFSLQAGARMGF